MGLRLHTVAPRQGWAWIRQAAALWWRRPLAFVGLFLFFLMTVLLLAMLVPVLGGVLGLALLPMLTLGFMIASRSALAKGPVHALQLVEGLRSVDRRRRRAQLVLCIAYAAGSMLVITLADWVDDGLFVQLQRLMAEQQAGQGTARIDAIVSDPRLFNGMVTRLGLAALLSVPFWHAPALVHWGEQGALQALFSSSVALWRARAAFTVYFLVWGGLMAGAALLVMLVSVLTGSRQLLGVLAMPLGLSFTAMFYVSLWFSFDDCFGAASPDGPAPEPARIEP